MKRIGAASALLAIACGGAAPAREAPPAAVVRSEPSREANVLASDAVAFVDGARLREHVVGARLGPLFEVLAGVRAMKKRDARFDGVRDAEWLLVRAPSFLALASAPVVARTNGEDEASRFGPIVAYDAASAPVGAARTGAREIFGPGTQGTVALPVSAGVPRGAEAVWLFLRAPGAQRGTGGEALWKGVRDVRVGVTGEGEGAHVELVAQCEDEAAASAFSERLAQTVARLEATPFVHAATRGVLAKVEVAPHGAVTRADVHASAEQLTAFLDLAAAAAGAPLAPLSPR